MAGGRPSDYKTEYCERVIELGRAGKSPVQIAVALGVPRTTMLSWADKHEEFSTALMLAKECEQDWWESQGQQSLTADRFNATVWTKSMQARFREDYTEHKKTEISGELNIASKEQRDAAVAAATRADR